MLISREKYYILILLSVAIFLACGKDSNPVKSGDDENGSIIKAVGCVLKQADSELIRAEKNKITGNISLKERTETPLLKLYLIAEDGKLFQPEEGEYSLAWEVDKMEIADVIQYEADGRWGFHIKGFDTGSTFVVFKIVHADQTDFVSLDLPITVTPDSGGGLGK
ncbi:MAG: hypothetical protein EHM72_08055 [Calditrichaeota bacterium]|nr:MAG: hypothetical protein EHM72_08055 [Calditrichota bacterium]